jgi:hypothetical protein
MIITVTRPIVSGNGTIGKNLLSILIAASLSSAAAAAPEEAADRQLFARISISFSSIPFDIPAKDVKINLAQAPYVSCENPWNCNFEDSDHVRHNFDGEEGRLAGKSLSAYYFDNKPIGALGIGMMRQKSDVLKQISLFVNQTDYICNDVPITMAGGQTRYSGQTDCTWQLGKGSVSAGFDTAEQLNGARFLFVTAGSKN